MHRIGRTIVSDNVATAWLRWSPNSAPANDDIDVDNDGVMAPVYRGVIDLSHALSRVLGRQMSQMAVYDVEEVHIALENVNDSDDNDEGAAFYGHLDWYEPSKHRMDALKLARAAEKALESTQIDADSFFLSSQKDYNGFRFTWNDATSIDNNGTGAEVAFPTASSFASVGATWAMEPIFGIYDNMQVGSSGDQHDNMLWDNKRTGRPNTVRWTAAAHQQSGAASAEYNPEFIDSGNLVPTGGCTVLGGLMELSVTGCSVDPPGSFDDDYYVWVGITIRGWKSF